MKIGIIEKSSDYSLFEMNKYQQPISEAHVNNLATSIQQNGFFVSKAITVYRQKNGKLRIVEGHHRFFALKALGEPIVYVVEDASVEDAIGDLNFAVKKWSGLSFVRMYAAKGDSNYMLLMKYIERGIPSVLAAALLRGDHHSSNTALLAIRAGNFKIKTTEVCDNILSIVDAVKDIAENAKSTVFIESLAMLWPVQEFDAALLVRRLRSNPTVLVKCATRDQMIALIEEIYNFRSQNKVPLAHLVGQLKRSRQRANLKK